jgi:hypothetical protein
MWRTIAGVSYPDVREGAVKEAEYLEQQIKALRDERLQIPRDFQAFQVEREAEIRSMMESAGIWQKVQDIRESIKAAREKAQHRSDILGGQLDALRVVFDKFHRVPVPDGTVMHGIDISKLDWETRLKVMNGDKRTIEVLGGTMDPPPDTEAVKPDTEAVKPLTSDAPPEASRKSRSTSR